MKVRTKSRCSLNSRSTFCVRPRPRSHRVSASRLNQLATSLPSTSRIAIIHGTEDNLIHVNRGKELHKGLPVRSVLFSIGTNSELTFNSKFTRNRDLHSKLCKVADTHYLHRLQNSTTSGSKVTSSERCEGEVPSFAQISHFSPCLPFVFRVSGVLSVLLVVAIVVQQICYDSSLTSRN